MIYHIVTPTHWHLIKDKNVYFPEAFQEEKFIHCATIAQLKGVLERYYAGAGTVYKLHIDESKLTSELIYEEGSNGDTFPHIYGGIRKDAIVGMEKMIETSPGSYEIAVD